jgi:hypothetical protein
MHGSWAIQYALGQDVVVYFAGASGDEHAE